MSMPYILLAEDDEDLRLLYSLFLQMKGFQVTSVPDGQAAYEEALQHRPDIILTDIAMPRLDGLELLRLVKGEKSLANLPVVVMTAFGKARLAMAKRMGADLTIEKPLDEEELYRALQQVISNPSTDEHLSHS